MPDDVPVQCPYCGETTWLVVDASAGAQAYVDLAAELLKRERRARKSAA